MSESQSQPERQTQKVRIATAFFVSLLCWTTWRIWVPGASDFPEIPLLSVGRSIPRACDVPAIIATLVSLWLLAICKNVRTQRIAGCVFFAAMSLSLMGNQHRLQPWMYQAAILTGFSITLPPSTFLRYARWLTISIYLFSAWSKLDYSFVHTLGQQFADVVLQPCGYSSSQFGDTTRWLVGLTFPLGELLVGIGLAWHRSRSLAAYVAIGLHVVLIGLLGPWGLNHHLGVMIWNAFFIALVWLLFVHDTSEREGDSPLHVSGDRSFALPSVAVAIILLPLLEPIGLLDHWPAWQLYAPRNTRVTMQVLQSEIDRLPNSLTPFIKGAESETWATIDVDAWSLVSLRVPIYPQNRFQLGAALALAERFELDTSMRVTVQSTADRRTDERTSIQVHGIHELRTETRRFRLNAIPRPE